MGRDDGRGREVDLLLVEVSILTQEDDSPKSGPRRQDTRTNDPVNEGDRYMYVFYVFNGKACRSSYFVK